MSDSTPYSIEQLLPEGQQRFLQIRECFMRICGNHVVRAGTLEHLHFETQRLLRPMDPSARSTEFNRLVRGTDPVAESDLWVSMSSKRILERLCGFAANRKTPGAAVAWLAEKDLIWTKTVRGAGIQRERLALLNVNAIDRALREDAGYTAADWEGAGEQVPGSVAILSLPATGYHAIYPVLVEAIAASNQESGDAPVRMSLLLLQALWLADQRTRRGRSPAASWSAREVEARMGFGDHRTWMPLLRQLGASRLLTRLSDSIDGKRIYEPNLPEIRSAIASVVEKSSVVRIPHTRGPNSPHLLSGSPTPVVRDSHTQGPNSPPGPDISELHPEPLNLSEGGAPVGAASSLPMMDRSPFDARTVRDTGLPSELRGIDLAQLSLRSDVVEKCAAADRKPLLLVGGLGTGKTSLAAAIMWGLMDRLEMPGRWVDLERLTPSVRRLDFSSDGYRAAIAQLMDSRPGPVVFDGLEVAGSVNATGAIADAMKIELATTDRPVIVTSELGLGDLHLAVGEKVARRLTQDAVVVDCTRPVWDQSASSLRAVGGTQ